MPSHGVPLSSNGSGASGLTLTPKNPLRDRRALKFYTEKIWGAPARAIPVTSCERPELPNRVEYHSARIEYHSTRPEYVPFEPHTDTSTECWVQGDTDTDRLTDGVLTYLTSVKCMNDCAG